LGLPSLFTAEAELIPSLGAGDAELDKTKDAKTLATTRGSFMIS
jgi:hypothetical protein